jgi:hypothetical protein
MSTTESNKVKELWFTLKIVFATLESDGGHQQYELSVVHTK